MDIKCFSRALSASFVSLLTIGLIAACGGGSSPPREEGGGESPPPTGVLSTPEETPETPEPVPTTTEETPTNSLPFTGTITLDDYDWYTASSAHLGVIELDISPLTKRRVFSGSFPRKHASGKVVFRQPCGSRVHRIVAARPGEVPIPLTPCSSAIDNPGASPTNFEFSILSADETKVAVETRYYLGGGYKLRTIVFNTSDQSVLAEFPLLIEPAWLKDGRLLMTNASDGLFITGTDLAEPTRLANGKPEGHIRNPAPHPDGNQIAFEMDQQIWKMNLDGSGLEVIVVGDRQFRFPEWSPDGSVIAYLGVPQGVRYDKAIYFTDLTSKQHYRLDVTPILDPINVSNTISGPLSWSE